MAEHAQGGDPITAALTALAADVAWPDAPATLTERVIGRLAADRAARRRPVLPGLALWSRRRLVLAVAAIALGALAVAGAARLTIGSVEVRVQPSPAPTASIPPIEPDVLGEPLPRGQAERLAGYQPDLPPGGAPDEVYVVDDPLGGAGLLYAWRPGARLAPIPGTDWGQVLLVFRTDEEVVVKTLERLEDVEFASVNGSRAFWIAVPHPVIVETERGARTFMARGNVLIWETGGLTYRLETTLDKTEADALAESFRRG